VLTHLLGQNISEADGKRFEVYRAAWKAAGHPGEGEVTLMVHTFVGSDLEQVSGKRCAGRSPRICEPPST